MSENADVAAFPDDDNRLGEEPGMLQQSEELDQDDLGAEPLDAGVEPPDHWAAADDFGTTSAEEAAGETLDQRLSRERPDVAPGEAPERPAADTDVTDFDERVTYGEPGTTDGLGES
jgi:hypothetical protein